jgi:hypothetical protein
MATRKRAWNRLNPRRRCGSPKARPPGRAARGFDQEGSERQKLGWALRSRRFKALVKRLPLDALDAIRSETRSISMRVKRPRQAPSSQTPRSKPVKIWWPQPAAPRKPQLPGLRRVRFGSIRRASLGARLRSRRCPAGANARSSYQPRSCSCSSARPCSMPAFARSPVLRWSRRQPNKAHPRPRRIRHRRQKSRPRRIGVPSCSSSRRPRPRRNRR